MLSAIIPDSLLEGTRGHEVAEVLYVIIPSPLSAERDNSRQLAGGNARARNSEGIICYNTFRFRLEGV